MFLIFILLGLKLYVCDGDSNFTDYGDMGWCFGGDDYYLGQVSSAEICWDRCFSRYGSELIAIDYWEDGFSSSSSYDDHLCFCQDNCPCRSDEGAGGTLLIHKDVTFPDECVEDPVYISEDVGWCDGGIDYFIGYVDNSEECWDTCYQLFDDNLYAVDFWSSVGACYCQDDCDCMSNIGSGGTLVISSYIASSSSELPNECNGQNDDNYDDYYLYNDDDDRINSKKNNINGATIALFFFIPFLVAVFIYMLFQCKIKPNASRFFSLSSTTTPEASVTREITDGEEITTNNGEIAMGELRSNRNGRYYNVNDSNGLGHIHEAPAVLVSSPNISMVSNDDVKIVTPISSTTKIGKKSNRNGGDEFQGGNGGGGGIDRNNDIPVAQAHNIMVVASPYRNRDGQEATI